jgi:hypothetical protein
MLVVRFDTQGRATHVHVYEMICLEPGIVEQLRDWIGW